MCALIRCGFAKGEIMYEQEVQPSTGVTPGLTQWQRVANTFSAPSKTFEDIKRGNKSWWMPFLLVVLSSYLLFAGVALKVGWQQVAENAIKASPKQADRLSQLPPDQYANAMRVTAVVTEISAAARPVIILLSALLVGLVLWGTVNFGLGGKESFGTILAVYFYASLPLIAQPLLGTLALFAGLAPESFNLGNSAGTNVAYYLPLEETNKALYALAMQFDIVNIWSAVLLSIGIAVVTGKKRSTCYAIVFSWWAVWALIRVAGGLLAG